PGSTSAQNGFFSSLAQSTTDYAICTLDTQGRLASWNPGAVRILGYEAADVLGRDFRCLYDIDTNSSDTAEFASLLQRAKDESRIEITMWCIRKEGTRFQARTTLCVAHDAESEALCGFVLIIQDLSESATVQQALFESEQRFR